MSVTVDPKCVLNHLNNLGYRNITAQQLKEFMIDLKKLIKFENRNRNSPKKRAFSEPDEIGDFCKLFEQKISCQNTNKENNFKKSKKLNARKELLVSGTRTQFTNTDEWDSDTQILRGPPVKARDRVEVRTGRGQTTGGGTDRSRPTSCKSVIRARSSSTYKNFVKSDPVALYHAYQSEWAKYEQQIPLGNRHLDLRWNIRQKTLS